MRRWILGWSLASGILLAAPAGLLAQAAGTQDTKQQGGKQQDDQAQAQAADEQAEPTLFDAVVEQLSTRYVDKNFREEVLPGIVDRYRAKAAAATTLEEQRNVTHALLRNIPATHLGMFSKASYDRLMRELYGRKAPSLGFEVLDLDGKYYVHNVLEGGPAEKAGLHRGDRVVSVDGVLTEDSPRLDWRTDDAFLDDSPVTVLLVEDGEQVTLELERSWGKTETVQVTAEPYSTWEAAKASARIVEHEGKKLGVIHFWLIHISGIPALLKEKLEGDFADCDALVLDLRGRGGSAGEIPPMLSMISGESADWHKPVVALIDHESRSAKEVIAYSIREQNLARLVGERTAGAVIPATFQAVGHDTVLMFPTFRLPRFTELIEGKGVAPDVFVESARPYSGGKDPILEAGLGEAVKMVAEAAAASATEETNAADAKQADVKTSEAKTSGGK